MRADGIEHLFELRCGDVGPQVGDGPAAAPQQKGQQERHEGVLLLGRAGDQDAPVPNGAGRRRQQTLDAALREFRSEVLLLGRGLAAIPEIADLGQSGDEQTQADVLDRRLGQRLVQRRFGPRLVVGQAGLHPRRTQILKRLARQHQRCVRRPSRGGVLGHLGRVLAGIAQIAATVRRRG